VVKSPKDIADNGEEETGKEILMEHGNSFRPGGLRGLGRAQVVRSPARVGGGKKTWQGSKSLRLRRKKGC